MADFSFPTNTERVAIVGRTGSGKTQFATWLLSRAPFHVQPYVIVDYKHDELIGAIDYLEEIRLGYVPKKPGLYVVRPDPGDKEEVNEWLRNVWRRERVGLYFDEMYEVPDPQKGSALRAIFTQGRSKRIPVIGLTQRPAFVSRFLFTEADHFACFHLNTIDDQIRMRNFVPGEIVGEGLPEFWCRWYAVKKHRSFTFQPAPDASDILETFYTRLKPKRRIF